MRYFDPTSGEFYLNFRDGRKHFGQHLATFRCRNCERTFKTFAFVLLVSAVEDGTYRATFEKIGETPRFGEPRPNAVTAVLDDEIEFFDRG